MSLIPKGDYENMFLPESFSVNELYEMKTDVILQLINTRSRMRKEK